MLAATNNPSPVDVARRLLRPPELVEEDVDEERGRVTMDEDGSGLIGVGRETLMSGGEEVYGPSSEERRGEEERDWASCRERDAFDELEDGCLLQVCDGGSFCQMAWTADGQCERQRVSVTEPSDWVKLILEWPLPSPTYSTQDLLSVLGASVGMVGKICDSPAGRYVGALSHLTLYIPLSVSLQR